MMWFFNSGCMPFRWRSCSGSTTFVKADFLITSVIFFLNQLIWNTLKERNLTKYERMHLAAAEGLAKEDYWGAMIQFQVIHCFGPAPALWHAIYLLFALELHYQLHTKKYLITKWKLNICVLTRHIYVIWSVGWHVPP